MLENISARKKCKIAVNQKQFMKYVKDPTYDRHVIINEDICIVILNQPTAKLIRPYYVGFTILEFAKSIMYDFFYFVLRPKFGDKNVDLIYSDTDSLCLLIRTEKIVDDLFELRSHFDFSNLHPTHPLSSQENKAVLFKFKEEFGLQPISRICALKSKTYSIEVSCYCKVGIDNNGICLKCKNTDNQSYHCNKLKGVNKSATREILFENYYKCLLENIPKKSIMYQIRSQKQNLTTVRLNKLSLSSFDDKRFILNCGIHSYPYIFCSYLPQSPYCFLCKM